jgi:uncharacterized protein (TIGR02118 family)
MNPAETETDMIRVTVFYPFSKNARFDHDYYRDTHLPLVKKALGGECIHFSIDKGLVGGDGGDPASVAACHIFCRTIEGFNRAFEAKKPEILGDITNYTDIAPQIEISEVVTF